LLGDLAGYRSIRTAGQRYRVIFKVYHDQGIVYVASVGIRKNGDKNDVYAIAKKLVKAGVLIMLFFTHDFRHSPVVKAAHHKERYSTSQGI
jgi:hypothetical protein